MKKIISILACVCLLLSAMVIPVSAEEITATISFADKANRTKFDTSVQVWEQNDITVTNEKSDSTNAVADYANPARFYAGSNLTIEYPGMTKIEVEAGSSSYANVFKSSDSNFTVSGMTATITFANPVDSFKIDKLSAQTRVKSITVYASTSEGGEETFEGTDPEAPIELAVNETTPATLKEIKVPAEGTVFVKAADANGTLHVTSADGSYMLINGMANQVTANAEYDLVLCGYEMVHIYNPGTETITLYVFLEAGAGEVVGTWDNPEVLELQENPWMPSFPPSANAETELEAGNQGHFYKITATEEGAFVVTVSAYDPTTENWDSVGYQFNVANNTTSWQSDFIARAVDAEDYYDSLFVPVKAGDEILINAGTFNPDDAWNAPAGTLNVQINFTTVGAYDYPVVLTETGTYTATVKEGSQGYYYEYVATEDGNVTVTMNDTSYQYQVNVIPADEEDWGAYVYGELHISGDDPAVASETVAVKVGDTVSIMVNTFNPDDAWNAPAGTVNWTLAFAEKVVNPGKITVSDADAEIGKEFTVTIDISENPGIIGATLNVNYDADVLELVKVDAGDFTNASDEVDEVVLSNYNFGPIENNPFMITWVDALAEENITTNGAFVTLTFRVKADAAVGTTEVSVTFAEDDIFDVELNNVVFEATAGTVTITEATGLPGDANGDGAVNSRDAAIILQYANGWTVTIDLDNADVNGDGVVNSRDYTLLTQYNNGWPVELK